MDKHEIDLTEYNAEELIAEIIRRGGLEELIVEFVKRGGRMELINALEDQGIQVFTPREYFRDQILVTLLELGGRASSEDVIARLEHGRRSHLTEYDRGELDSGEVRWKKNAHFARNQLREEGLIAGTSEWGIWELTATGKVKAELNKEE